MKKTIILATAAIMILAVSCKQNAQKNNGEQPQSSTTKTELVDDENDPKALAKQAFDRIIQLEGRDSHEQDANVVKELEAIEKKAEKLSEADREIYNAELQRLYTGE